MPPSMAALLRSYGADAEPGSGWRSVRCPFHDDTRSSASFNEAEGVFKCHACGVSGDAGRLLREVSGMTSDQVSEALDAMPASGADLPAPVGAGRYRRSSKNLSEAASVYASDVGMVSEYLRGRGVGRDQAVAGRLGYVVSPLPGHESMAGRLSIPYITAGGGVVDIKFRSLPGGAAGPKYLCLPGSRPRMFQAPVTLLPSATIVLTEGEMDAFVLWRCLGVPAVGIPGASQWQPYWERVLDGYGLVLVCGDGDEAGERFAATTARRLDTGSPVVLPKDEDINSLWVRGGVEAVLDAVPALRGPGGGINALPAVR